MKRRQFAKLSSAGSLSTVLLSSLKQPSLKAQTASTAFPTSTITAQENNNLSTSTITVARLPLSMYAINSAFVEIVAEQKGFKVEYLDGLHKDLFPALAEGKADILTSLWLPYGHRTYWETYGSNYITIGTIFQNGISYFVVPDYVDRSIQSVSDLTKPEIAEGFNKKISTIHVGTSMYEKSAQIVTDYGLDKVGFQVEPGDSNSWQAALEEAIAKKEWIVFPLWEPHFLNNAYNLRPLVEPQGIFGGREATFLVANSDWARQSDPNLLASLSRINLSLDDLNQIDYQVNVDGLTPRAAVENYFQDNPGLLESWTK